MIEIQQNNVHNPVTEEFRQTHNGPLDGANALRNFRSFLDQLMQLLLGPSHHVDHVRVCIAR